MSMLTAPESKLAPAGRNESAVLRVLILGSAPANLLSSSESVEVTSTLECPESVDWEDRSISADAIVFNWELSARTLEYAFASLKPGGILHVLTRSNGRECKRSLILAGFHRIRAAGAATLPDALKAAL